MTLPRLLPLVAAISLAATSTAQAQALPAPIYTIQNASALARAAVVWGAASLVVGGEAASTAGATVATAGGGFLGLTPVAGISAGLAVLGVSMYVSVRGIDGTKRDLLMLIGANSYALNPDYGATSYTLIKGPWVWPSYPYIYTANDPATDAEFKNKIMDQLIATKTWTTIDPNTLELPTKDPSVSNTSNQIYFRFKGQLPSQTTMSWFGSYVNKYTDARSCPAGYTYSVETTGCILLNDTIEEDQTCRVSYENGVPVYNIKDPDCALAKSSAGFTVQPPTSTTPALVMMTEPDTGRTLKTELYTDPAQGYAPGTFKTTERAPDYTNSVVRESSTLMMPVAGSPNPVVQQSVQKTYDGTSATPTPGQTPLDKVSIGNWPTSLDGLGSAMQKVADNTSTIANNTLMMENVLEQISHKLDNNSGTVIDTQIPPGSATLPESAPADLANREVGGMLQPLKDKLAGFFSFEFPAHTSTCPAIEVHTAAWGIAYDLSSNSFCDWLEEYRSVIQAVFSFAYLLGAILIVLGA